jgi:hypothetical protein
MMWIIIIGLGLGLISAPFIYLYVSLEKKEQLAKTISIVGGFIAALSLFWAAYTYSDSAQRQIQLAEASAKLQRELAASSLYREHMTRSMDNPGLANAELARKPPTKDGSDEERADAAKEKYEKYRWYVGHALYSFESILAVDDDPEWKITFRQFIKDHGDYIGSDFPCNRYDKKLNDLIKDVLNKDCTK